MKTNQIAWDKTNAVRFALTLVEPPVRDKMDHIDGYFMAGKKGQSGPPGNANAFRHGLAALQNRRANGALTVEEQDIRFDILAGLIADKGGEQQIGTAERILAEIISSDVALLVTFNQAIERRDQE